MEFWQLEAFNLIVDTGSFSEAAKQMGITQPTVSVQISALEREFGRLLERQPGKAVATQTGQALYRYAAEILALRDKAVATHSKQPDMDGTITIAASSIPYQFVLPVLAAQFSMQHPDVRFSLLGGDSADAARRYYLARRSLAWLAL